MTHILPELPVLRKEDCGYAWEDEGYPDLPLTYRIWVDNPYARNCRIRVTTFFRAGREKIVELNNIPTTPKELQKGIKEIMVRHTTPETDVDWLYVLLSQHSLRRGVEVEEDGNRRKFIPPIEDREIEVICDTIARSNETAAAESRKNRYSLSAILFGLTAFALCEKFAKNFLYY